MLSVWRGSFKLTNGHATFFAYLHPNDRRNALVDYWLGRIAVFASWYVIYLVVSTYTIAEIPQHIAGETFVALDVDLTPTRFFYVFFAAFSIFTWQVIFKGDVTSDSRLLKLPNGLPPRLPIIAHSQLFWRDYYRHPAERAYQRLETLTNVAQQCVNNAGLTKYWLRPWGPPIVYVSNPHSIRDVFMLEEFVEVYIGGRASRCLPKALISCGFGHPMDLLQPLLLRKDMIECEAKHYVSCGKALIEAVRCSSHSDSMELIESVSAVVLDAICAFAIGPDFCANRADFRASMNVAVDGAANVLSAPPPSFPITSWLWQYLSIEGRSIAHATNIITKYIAAEVIRRRRRMKESPASMAACLADHLLRQYPSATNDEIVEDVVALIVQKYSVVVSGVVWSTCEILQAKNMSKKVSLIRQQGRQAVADAVVSNTSTSRNLLHAAEQLDVVMPTLERCVREALRLHPPAPALAPLTLLKDVKLSGFTVKAKSEVRLLPYMVQRSCKYWGGQNDSELLFKEERWKEGARAAHQSFSHYEFGAGLLKSVTPESTRKGIQYICWCLLSEFTVTAVADKSGAMQHIPRSSVLLPSAGYFVTAQKN